MEAARPPVCVIPVMKPMSKESETRELLPVVSKLSEVVVQLDCPVK